MHLYKWSRNLRLVHNFRLIYW